MEKYFFVKSHYMRACVPTGGQSQRVNRLMKVTRHTIKEILILKRLFCCETAVQHTTKFSTQVFLHIFAI